MTRRIAIVGGGISGLTAAYRLRRALGDDTEIDLFDSGAHMGGLLRTADVGGRMVDVGAEAFVVRRPEALGLVRELGLEDRIVSPTARRPAVWSDDRLHPLPAPAVMGIPASAEVVAGLADAGDLARMADEADRPLSWRVGEDRSIGDLVADRFGPSVVARSVDPMLGGVYASLSRDIGVREAVPALVDQLDGGAASLTAAVDAVQAAGAGATGPVFGTLVGGYRVLVDALIASAGIVPRAGATVNSVHERADGWTVGVCDETPVDYDGVVLAVPAGVAGALLSEEHPDVGGALCDVPRASSMVVSIALEPGTPLPDHSGVLVATDAGLRAKAFTFSSQKWAHLSGDGGPVSVRASFGRYGAPVPTPAEEPEVDQRIRVQACEDLDRVCAAAGVEAPSRRILDVETYRWNGGLPVYRPGHLAAMSTVQRARPRRLVLAGSAYAGVGVPACIGQAGRAAADLIDELT
ncbi:protoporphyrinogen oxidase [Gordonia sp. HNM0687]|uniref:Coproporphyrinogen III oxidase n=1 Tax=Gordonia mangrovi TaxID=2665643 RepID=A0A6L7GUH6_9ACTN|nr:protoporphyrinogen oxidase [Gordonia mangrovi]MXP22325.1 protoporphyrinogen oxidase [Gordonia mangrovi]UVF77781.1 protoporphyrinogen oxidase [Gordonia mangrovi]